MLSRGPACGLTFASRKGNALLRINAYDAAEGLNEGRVVLNELLEEKVASLAHPAVAVTGLRIPWIVEDVVQRLEEDYPGVEMTMGVPLSAGLAVHGGPGTFVMAVADLPTKFA